MILNNNYDQQHDGPGDLSDAKGCEVTIVQVIALVAAIAIFLWGVIHWAIVVW